MDDSSLGMKMVELALHFFEEQLVILPLMFAVFVVLERISPAVPNQKIFRKNFLLDLWYTSGVAVVYVIFSTLVVTIGLVLIYRDAALRNTILEQGNPLLTQLPIWVQLLLFMAIREVLEYAIHRKFHGGSWWKWHAIHHMPKELDWLSNARFHPVNMLVKIIFATLVTALIGFSPEVAIYYGPFIAFYAGLVHANLNWTFGPLKYVFASPTFHRWHHTSPDYGGDKNFSQVFVFMDLLFGTFYLPKGMRPEEVGFGVKEDIPEGSFFGQLAWPFKQG